MADHQNDGVCQGAAFSIVARFGAHHLWCGQRQESANERVEFESHAHVSALYFTKEMALAYLILLLGRADSAT
jgi:hypothetical protein